LIHLHGLGHACSLPEVAGPDKALVFRAWKPGDRLLTGRLGEPKPDSAAPELFPDVLLVPLLSFDRDGFRLGYGGGHYDRTLAALRNADGILAVGLAYAAQEVDTVPRDGHDARLDWVVTEQAAIETGA
jgi:5-formyltetrahydrofolate cyclo-ligase